MTLFSEYKITGKCLLSNPSQVGDDKISRKLQKCLHVCSIWSGMEEKGMIDDPPKNLCHCCWGSYRQNDAGLANYGTNGSILIVVIIEGLYDLRGGLRIRTDAEFRESSTF